MADTTTNPLEGIEIPQGPPPEPDQWGPFAALHERIDRLEEAVAVQLAALARRNNTTTNPAMIQAQIDSYRTALRTQDPEPDDG